jgi:hypothetical protein
MPPPALQRRTRPDLARVEEVARAVLTAPRALTPQVLQYLLAHYEVRGEGVVAWLRSEFPGLESYEHDLLLSPLFTPDAPARLAFEEALGEGWLEGAELDGLIASLAGRGLELTLVHENESVVGPLPAVLVERYLRLLHLDAALPLDEVEPFRPLAAEVRAYLRDRAWSLPGTRRLLPLLLRAARGTGEDFPRQVSFLTDFVRTHRPATREECVSFLTNMARAYEDDLRNHQSGARPFFNEELKGSYSGKWRVAEDVVAEHKAAITRAHALLAALATEP